MIRKPRPLRLRHGFAGAADAADMAALHRASFPRGWSAQDLAQILSEPGAVAPAAWRGRKLMGFALGRVAADEAEVLSLAVAEQARGRGVGARLLEALEDACRAQGARKIFLEVSERNVPAMTLYYRGDYREIGRRPNYYGDGATAMTMRKFLTAD